MRNLTYDSPYIDTHIFRRIPPNKKLIVPCLQPTKSPHTYETNSANAIIFICSRNVFLNP